MYARTTQLEIDTLRTSVDAALRRFEQEILPELAQQDGFRGVYVLTTPQGQAMLVSFWDSDAQADAGQEDGWYARALAGFATAFRAPPGRGRYEVRIAMAPTEPVPA